MSTTGHESEAINVGGLKASMQKLKTEYLIDVAHLGDNDGSAVIADFDPQTDTVWKKAQTLSAAEKAQVKTNLGLPQEIYSKTEVNDLVDTPHQNYVTVATYASLPASGSADTIYRVSNYNGSTSQVDATMYSEYAWNGSAYVFLNVKSQVGEVFDISEYNASAKYADLAAALGNNGANVPEGVRKGGMSVKYVNTDNKYVQYRLMNNQWSTTVTDWQGVDEEPIPLSKNLIKSGGVSKQIEELNLPLGKIESVVSLTIAQSNHFIDIHGSVVELQGGYISSPVFLSKGDCVFLQARNSGNIGAICLTDESGSTYTRVKKGAGGGSTIPLQIVSYKIVADGFYAFSWYGEEKSLWKSTLSVINSIQSSIDSHSENIATINENIDTIENGIESSREYYRHTLGVFKGEIEIPIGQTDKLINHRGEVLELTNGYISSPLYFDGGQLIKFTARGSASTGMICKTDEQGTSYTVEVIGSGSGHDVPMQTVTYLIVEGGYYVFSWYDNSNTGRVCIVEEDKAINNQKFNLLAMFDNITYCGDSLTYSQVSTSASTYRPAKKIYPEIVSGICGNTPTVLAHPGDTAKRWWEVYSNQLVAKTNNLYMIYLGTNGGLTDTIDTDCPVGGSVSDYADTNTGCYGKLLKTIQNLGDKAILIKIVPDLNYSQVTNEVIDKFGERFNFPVVENERINELVYRYYPDGSGYDNLHLNDLGYSYFANRLIRKVSELSDTMLKRLVII